MVAETNMDIKIYITVNFYIWALKKLNPINIEWDRSSE